MKKLSIVCLFFLFSISVSGLGISGSKVKWNYDFTPGLSDENSYYVVNNDGYTSNYYVYPIHIKGADLTKYFTVTPDTITGVQAGKSKPFKVSFNIPDNIDIPGISETWVKVKIVDTAAGAGILRARPSLAIRYIFSVLYPFKYLNYGFVVENMNLNETKNMEIKLANYGEPTIDSAYADIEVINLENNEVIQKLRTNTETNIESREKKIVKAEFSSYGLNTGSYQALATFYWDKNISYLEKNFSIGTKKVDIHDFTRLFEIDSINKFYINISSGWNTEITDIFADIGVFDLETNGNVANFKSLNTELEPWEDKTLEAFFDTSGLEKKEYNAVVKLRYGKSITEKEGIIKIDENVLGIHEETPSGLTNLITPINGMILLLVIFLITNVILVVKYLNKDKKVLDPAVVKHVRGLMKINNDDYIRDMMLKKGWPKKKIEKLIKEAKK